MFQRFISFSTAAALILAMLPIFASSPAQARFPRGSASGCAYATDNGCLLANANGSFKDATLLTSAQQSGQNSLLPTHPMTFNIPGVDYPISYNKTLTLKDPRTIINDGVCQWAVTFLDCSSIGSGVVNEVLDGYDFSGTTIGQSAAGIWAPNNSISAGSTLTITNSKFALIPSAVAAVNLGGNFSNLVFKNNLCDGTNANSASGFCVDSAGVLSGTMDVEYNAFTNQGVGRIAGGLTNNSFTLKYNYISGLNTLNTTNHGELMLRNCSSGRANCTAFDDYEGNFIVWTCCVAFTGGNGDNATIFPGDGASDGVTLSSMTFSTNIVVVNTTASGGLQPDQAMFNSRLATMGVVNMSNNWVDASGSNGCSVNGAKSGGNTVTASSSGNTLTVTGLSGSFGNNPIEPGWLILHSGFATATITAYGTGSGNTGTYIFGGATQNVGSDSLWTLVPGFSSFTAANNYLLNDPGHTGIPTAIGLSGPQMTATNCF